MARLCTPMKVQTSLLAATALLLAASLVRAPYPREQWLQHAPTVAAMAGLAWAARRRWMADRAFACVVAMLGLHIAGARWIYSYVPYEQFCDALVGSGPHEWFAWKRNHYDRLVHFAYGALATGPIAEALHRHARQSWPWALLSAIGAVAAASALYEIFEWLLSVIAAPEFAEHYNGQQGDAWDAQKDMALAIAASLAAAAWLARRGPPRSALPPAPTPRSATA
ncbi:MAG TPA: DUF2238 domain-containing protein [Lacipirellulaceae bacterium]|nr:DUF2238 domain-containing protein [Lacipirellulaceae bacterium]